MPVIQEGRSPEEPRTKVPDQLNNGKIASTCSFYKYLQLDPTFGVSDDIVLNIATTKKNEWVIDPEVCNMGNDYLEYDLVIDQTPIAPANRFLALRKNIHGEFRKVFFRDSSGNQKVVDVEEADTYQYFMNELAYSQKDLQYHDTLNGIKMTNAPLSAVENVREDGKASSVAFLELQQLEFHPESIGAAGVTIHKKVYLKELLPYSYFAQAKNDLWPLKMKLIIEWSSLNLGYLSDSPVGVVNADFIPDNTVHIKNLHLRHCLEKNQTLINQMIAQTANGRTQVIPFPTVNFDTKSSTAMVTFQQELDPDRVGSVVQRITTAFVAAEPATPNLTYSHSNVDGETISEYQVLLNSAQKYQDNVMVSGTDDDDYMFHRDKLKNTLIYNRQMYRNAWFDLWDFDSCGEANDNKEGFISIGGHTLIKTNMYKFKIVKGANNTKVLPFNPKFYCIVNGLKRIKKTANTYVVLP